MIAVFSLSVAFSWGQVRATRPPASSPPKQQSAAPGKAVLSDAEVENAIRERLSRSKISKNGFQVRVRNGTAVLEGKTDVSQHKGTATRIARSAGARTVDNRIQLSEAAKQKMADKRRSAPRSEPRRVQVTRSEPRQAGS